METRKLRLIRQKYHISLQELGDASGISEQRMSEIELNLDSVQGETLRKIQTGLSSVLSRRFDECCSLQALLEYHYNTLLDVVEETTYEL